MYTVRGVVTGYDDSGKYVKIVTRDTSTGLYDNYRMPGHLPITNINIIIYGYDAHGDEFDDNLSDNIIRGMSVGKYNIGETS